MAPRGVRGARKSRKANLEDSAEALMRATGGTSSSAAVAAAVASTNSPSSTTNSDWMGESFMHMTASQLYADMEATCGIYVPSRLDGAQGQQGWTDWSADAATTFGDLPLHTSWPCAEWMRADTCSMEFHSPPHAVPKAWVSGLLPEGEGEQPAEERLERDRTILRTSCRKTIVCRFFLQGACSKGSSCNFAHGHVDLRDRPDLAKTTICKSWLNGRCPFLSDECPFAHGKTIVHARSFAMSAGATKVTPEYGYGVSGFWPGSSVRSDTASASGAASTEVALGTYDARAGTEDAKSDIEELPPWPMKLADRRKVCLAATV